MKSLKGIAVMSSLAIAMMLGATLMASADSTVTQSDDTSTVTDSAIDSPSAAYDKHRQEVIADMKETEGYFKIICDNVQGDPIQGLRWRVYRVGQRNLDEFVFDSAFSDMGLDLTSANSEKDVKNLALLLEGQVGKGVVDPVCEVSADSMGIAEGKLPYGLYLFILEEYQPPKKNDMSTVYALPILAEINDWTDNKTTVIKPKFSSTPEKPPYPPHDSSIPDVSTPDSSSIPDTPSKPDTSTPDTTSTPTTTTTTTTTTTNITNNPHTAGKATVKTIGGGAILALAAGAGSLIGRRKNDEDSDKG